MRQNKPIPLKSGAYQAAALIADAQRCVNLFPEINPPDSPFPTTHYLTPGLTALAQDTTDIGVWRGLYAASSNDLYGVVGANVVFIDTNWNLNSIGTITPGVTPVSMADNGTTMVLVDGTPNGYQVNLASRVMTQIVDANFLGADKADFMDTFLVFNQPGTQNFYSTTSSAVTPFNPLYIAAKTDSSDLLSTLVIVNRVVWLLGQKSTELWYDAGNAIFPFSELPGVIVQHGCIAKYSAATYGQGLYWLGQNRHGRGVVYRGLGYTAKRISTHAIEDIIQKYPTMTDAIGLTYQQGGHSFYALSFPSGNATWVFDEATGLWHQRASIDAQGNLNRWRVNCYANAYGIDVVGDYSNGTLYRLDVGNFTENGTAIPRIRSFPHMVAAGKRAIYHQFIAEFDAGHANSAAADPKVALRYSDDRGQTFSNPIYMPLPAGKYNSNPSWRRLGMARDRVFELSWSAPFATALSGAYIDATELGS